jgi:hypothetical protein
VGPRQHDPSTPRPALVVDAARASSSHNMLRSSELAGITEVASVLQPTKYPAVEQPAGKPVRHPRAWAVLTAVEVVAASTAVLLDVVVPSLVLLEI